MLRYLRSSALASCVLLALAGWTAGGIAATAQKTKYALEPVDQARARRALPRSSDLGASWHLSRMSLGTSGIGARCPGFNPSLPPITVRGQAGSQGQSTSGAITTIAVVLSSAGEARAAQRLLTAPFVLRCFRPGRSVGTATYDSLKRLSLTEKNVSTIAYRIHVVSKTRPKELFADYVYLQAGRTWLVALFAGTKPIDASIERHVLASVSSRMAQ